MQKNKPSNFLPIAAALLLVAGAGPTRAQTETTGTPPSPAEEPSSFETLFEQSDMGNVVSQARSHFHSGVRNLKRAEKLENKAATEGDSTQAREKVQSAYDTAVQDFTEAIRLDPKLLEAYAKLGHTFARLGRHAEALQVHSAALKRAPDDPDNFAGWAESILALNMLGDATQAYTAFAGDSPEKAEVLMTAMKDWLQRKRTDPGGLDPADVERLAVWIQEQQSSG